MRWAVFLTLLLVPRAVRGGIWEDVAGRGEAELRAAVAFSPGDFQARRALAELLSATNRTREAVRQFEAAVAVAPTAADQARMWFRLGNERTRLGAYAESLDAYERQLALGDFEPAALANSAELLMAAGRTAEAINRYREAVAIEEREPNRREHLRGVALGYFGLGVALDRAGSAAASREAITRAVALDPGLAVVRLAGQPDSDVFFVPAGENYYYLALAREAQGRPDDAAVALRDYLRVARGPYVGRAREHLARLMAQPPGGEVNGAADGGRRGGPDGRGGDSFRPGGGARGENPASQPPGAPWRVLHQATLRADGPLVAPLIDAAWRLHPRLLTACLAAVEEAPAPSSSEPASAAPASAASSQVKISVELRIDDSGRVTAATARVPPPLAAATLAPCIETALVNEFRVSPPARRKPTLVRMELVLAPARPGGV